MSGVLFFSTYPVFALTMQEKPHPRIAAFPIGEGGPRSGARVLSLTAHLRRSFPLFFIPLVPYPARSARHLPLEGKAVSGVLFFSTYPVFALTMQEKPHPRIAAFPIGEGGPRSGARVLSLTAHLRRSFPLFFIPLVPYPARSARHLPLEGKAVSVVILFLHVSCIRFDDTRIPSSKKRRRSRHESLNPEP